jgi:putative transposase
MAQSLSRIALHIIFSTAHRRRTFLTSSLRHDLCGYFAGTLNRMDCPAIEVGSATDHVHLLCNLSRTMTVAKLVGDAKAASSRWVKQQRPETKDPLLVKFEWQKGYAAFSVSPSSVAKARCYVRAQEEHHRRVSFMDEYRSFMRRHEVQYDEQHVWG